MSVKSKAFRLMIYVLAVYVLLCAFMYFNQRNMQYFPQRVTEFNPNSYGLAMQVVNTTTADGLTLKHWYAPAQPDRPTIVYFHGNAGFVGTRRDRAKALIGRGLGLYLAEYRGYGVNGGAPTERGLILDAQSVMEDLKSRGVDNIVIYGESIGTGVAIQIATQYTVKAVILEAPFTSATDIAQNLYPFIPVKFLMKDQFKSIDHIRNIDAPLLFMHGTHDSVIPIKFSEALFDHARGSKTRHLFDGVGHIIEFDTDIALNVILDFLKDIKVLKVKGNGH